MSLTSNLLIYNYKDISLAIKIEGNWHKSSSNNILFTSKYNILSVDLLNPNELKYGNIFYGQIIKFHKSLNCYIVDLGKNNVGLLKNNKQNLSLLKPVTLGKKFLCMVKKEGDTHKYPIISPYISLEGLYCNFNPLNKNILFSSYIKDSLGQNNDFLYYIQEQYNISNGLIIKNKSNPKALIKEITILQNIWKNILLHNNSKLGLIYAPPSILNLICEDYNNVPTTIVINDLSLLESLKNELMDYLSFLNIHLSYSNINNIFLDLLNNLENYLGNSITINNEITLHIHNSKALTFIDIDYNGNNTLTKEEALFNANLTAIPHIVKIIKLRNITGQIFIDTLKIKENKEILLNKYKDELQKHIFEIKVLGYTKLGIIEIERPKKRNSITNKLFCSCYICNTGILLSNKLIDLKTIIQIRLILENNPLANIVIKSSSQILNTFKLSNKNFLNLIPSEQISYVIDENIINNITVY